MHFPFLIALMELMDLSLETPERNLALDEALLEEAEAGRAGEVLRFWESPVLFVVLGAGGVVRDEVHLGACDRAGVAVLRRCSGGGTVLQGPGCLNYTLVLSVADRAEVKTIDSTNRFILERTARALEPFVAAERAGTSDLAVGGCKFSGSAQRRKKHFIMFHGTVLHSFDLQNVAMYLGEPKRRPQYRGERKHEAFLCNIAVPVEQVKSAIADGWKCHGMRTTMPDMVDDLIARQYARDEWNFRF